MIPINIIGMGLGKSDLTKAHLDIISSCDLLVGGKRMLEMVDTKGKQTLAITGRIDSVVDTLKEKAIDHKIAVLASGDPLFHGIGATLTRHFDPDDLIIHPNVSSVCAAFAVIKEPWHDARIISLHGKEKDNFSFASLAKETKVAFLTDPEMDPHFIAGALIKEGLLNIKFCVLENLGDRDRQRIQWFDNLEVVSGYSFAQPNIVIIKKQMFPSNVVSRETYIGMPEGLFRHGHGLITKAEVRTISLSKLKLIRKDHVLWDIGAGSGSVSIEAASLLPWGHVYAIEKHSSRIPDIIHNIQNFNCPNIQVVHAVFPEGMEELKKPDRIFIGGGGIDLENILKTACGRIAQYGILVINTVLLESLERSIRILEENNFKPDITQIQVARSKDMAYGRRLESLNPVWIISGTKP